MIQRSIKSIIESQPHRGFLGQGHTARAVIDGNSLSQSDPFILLMDDSLDLPGGKPVGGPHPHAGFETVTLVIQGDEKNFFTGSLEIMTAGSGIIHTEEITQKTQMRILQLWLTLPPDKRWIEPSLQQIFLEDVPIIHQGKSEIRVYSGNSQGLTSPIKNHTPLTLIEFRLDHFAEASQTIPSYYNSLFYVIDGEISLDGRTLSTGQTAWLNRSEKPEDSMIAFKAGAAGAHVVFYAGAPQHSKIISHGPFIGDSNKDIDWLYHLYHSGGIPHLEDLPSSRKTVHKTARE